MLAWISGKILAWRGWTEVGSPPSINKYLVIVAPHTSNWDFFIFLLFKFKHKLKISFIGKHTIFIWPFRWFLTRIGGIPVNRSGSNKVVDSIVQAFNENEKMIFALSPEGTRSLTDHWKSGFYHIAMNAKVPIQMCFLDKKDNSLGFGPLIHPCGDKEKDLAIIREFYQNKVGINPKQFSNISFKKAAQKKNKH
ncbi:1-acyl-sn-glycerol-3-phosphate acyltransferase [Aliikangiella sp. IMCC44653]